MRPFSEVLLLASFTLLSSLFVNGFQKFIPTVNHKLERRHAVIRGLLVPRQGPSSCPTGFFVCESTGCCPPGWNCCSDSNCCDAGFYCGLADNGKIGCCPTGEVCTGSVGGPTTIAGPPGPLPTQPVPPPVSNPLPPLTSPVPTAPTSNSVPFIQSTVAPVSTKIPTSLQNILPSSSSSGSFPLFSAAGQAQLYRPLLLVLFGILLAVIY